MSQLLTNQEISELDPMVQTRLNALIEVEAISVKDGNYYFPTKSDPLAEEPRTKLEVVQYAVWNTAATFYNVYHS